MFSHWLFVRLRAAERALAEGRLDEAYGLAAEPDIREQRRGQKLLDDLVRPLLARVRLHLQAGRYEAAGEDLERLQAVGRGGPEAEELRQRVQAHTAERRQRESAERAVYDEAAANVQAGRLDSGRLAIERVDDTQQREDLRERLDIRVQRSAELLTQAGDALDRGDVPTALRLWQEAGERHGRSRESDAFAGRLATAYERVLEEWLRQGQLGRFLAARAGLGALSAWHPGLEVYERMAGLWGRAAEQLGERNYAGLRETVLRLRAARSGLGWVDELHAALTRITEGQDMLLASPLGLLATMAGPAAAPAKAAPTVRANEVVPPPPPASPHDALLGGKALLLLVDGAGSSLVLGQDRVRLGRSGGSREIDVPIPASIRSHHADIVRDGGDYFLVAHGRVRVNRRDVQRTLLRDGDRIVLEPGGKLVFRKPSVRSDTAVLHVSHRCRLPQDVSQVLLFRETGLIGPQTSCHVRTPDGATQVVLFDRGGRLCGREATSGGGKLGDAKALRLGTTHDFGDVRLTMKVYEMQDEPLA
ncbi:MAG: FHA domain-containing protein [Phycisphaerae bacterium]|jgi:hypothetical protein